MPRNARYNPLALVASAVALPALWLPTFVARPSRVMPLGEPVGLWQAPLAPAGWALAVLWALIAVAALLPAARGRAPLLGLLTAVLTGLLTAGVGWGSLRLHGDDPMIRIGLAGGGWLMLASCGLVWLAVRAEAGRWLWLPALAGLLAWVSVPYGGLGMVAEYRISPESYHDALLQHLRLVAAALPLTLALGLPLGIAAYRWQAAEAPVLAVAGFLQTLPSVALYGLLLPLLSLQGKTWTLSGLGAACVLIPLAVWLLYRFGPVGRWLAVALAVSGTLALLPLLGVALHNLLEYARPWQDTLHWHQPLAEHGLRGLGVAPAVTVLTLYGLLPVVVQTHLGLRAVPAAAREAARGMGMRPMEVFRLVELPLALPYLVEGLRGSLLLLVGLASLAVLVNGGGLGYYLMRGVEQAVLDMVLLGAVSVAALALAVDALLRGLVQWLTPEGVRP